MNLPALIATVQTQLGLPADGLAGPQTWAAVAAHLGCRIVTATPPAADAGSADLADSRSEASIATLHPRVRPYARALVHSAAAQGLDIKVTSGTRSYAEQQAIFDRHDGTTRAPAGHSNHNFGLAFDVTLFDGAEPVWESPNYKAVGALGKALGLTWGGDWQSIDDAPHFELRPAWAATMSEGAMLAELRDRHDVGRDQFA